MNEYLPKSETDPQDPKKPSANRVMVWIVVTGVGLYLLISGIVGIVTAG
ncbi:MAG: hypothetical protein ABWX65_12500 [Mycetocola sp.]